MIFHSPSPDHSRPLAIVTGASSGIGAAVAVRLAGRGYRVVLIARRQRLMEQVAAQCRGGAAVHVEPLDLSLTADIEPVFRRILDAHGPAQVLVNNAGVGLYKRFLDHDRADFTRLMQVNFLAPVETTRVVLPGMLDRGSGTVINIASMAAKIGPWGHAAYAAAKAALASLTQTLTAEHAGSGVHFCYVNPGIVRTDYFNQPDTRGLWAVVEHRAIEVGPVADRIVKIIDHPRLEVCIPRHYRLLDCVTALSPRLAMWLVARGSRPSDTSNLGPDTLQPPATPGRNEVPRHEASGLPVQ